MTSIAQPTMRRHRADDEGIEIVDATATSLEGVWGGERLLTEVEYRENVIVCPRSRGASKFCLRDKLRVVV